MMIVQKNIGYLGVKMTDNEYTINEISQVINIAPNQIRLFTGHFTLSKYIIRTHKYKSHPCLGINITSDFINDFITYLSTVKARKYKEERRKFIKKQLERLLYA